MRDYDADEAHPSDEFRGQLPELIRKARRIYHVLGRDAAVDAQLIETLEALRLRSRQGVEPADAIVDPRAIVHAHAAVQGAGRARHHAARRRDQRRGARGGRAARAARRVRVRAGGRAASTPSGAAARAAPPTRRSSAAAATPRCCTTCATTRSSRDGELVLIDAGCELEGYASDVTRTYPVGGRFSGPARALYEVVLAAQQAALAALPPGHDAARDPRRGRARARRGAARAAACSRAISRS